MRGDAGLTRRAILVAGAIARRPRAGGHAWVFLQYLLGLGRLGYDVLFVDWLDAETCGGTVERSSEAAYLARVMDEHGLATSWSLLDRTTGAAAAGLPRAEVLERARRSSLLLNVMGYLDDEEILAAAPLRVFLDIDPGFPQMWRELGLADVFAGHDRFVTIGERVALEGCGVPTCGLDWIRTRPPVVLERWPVRPVVDGSFTTVGSWRGAFAPIEYQGTRYGLRAHELRKFARLPERSTQRFELALDLDEADAVDRELLEQSGWRLVDPVEVAADPSSYQAYIAASRAELMVAKGMYVDTRSGWFSDRSTCYLASGKPVVAQNTGLEDLYPLDAGLLAFSTLDEAAAAVEEVATDYERHALAAREIAEEYFDSDKVLGRLLERLATR
jgi:hypothetical protein